MTKLCCCEYNGKPPIMEPKAQTGFLEFSRPVRDIGNAVRDITSGKEERLDGNRCNPDSKYLQPNTELNFEDPTVSGLGLIYVEDNHSTFYQLTTRLGMRCTATLVFENGA